MPNVAKQVIPFTEVDIEKVTGLDFPCDTIFDFHFRIFRLVGSEDMVPDVEQVAEVGIHVKRIPRMVYPMVGWSQDDSTDNAESCIF